MTLLPHLRNGGYPAAEAVRDVEPFEYLDVEIRHERRDGRGQSGRDCDIEIAYTGGSVVIEEVLQYPAIIVKCGEQLH